MVAAQINEPIAHIDPNIFIVDPYNSKVFHKTSARKTNVDSIN
jgi:hypothetical protein